VLIDTPPVLTFADARMVGRMADGVIIVVRANRTDRAEAMAAAQRIFEDGTPIVGAVLNDWDPNESPYACRSYGYTYS
jgi:Mrp family chromosome partitioning ATPase